MRKITFLILCILAWSPWASAQEAAGRRLTAFEGDVKFGYRWVQTEGNLFAGEFEYPHSSLAGEMEIEYDPLPQRFLFEAYVNNEKDYHTELDYSSADILLFNFVGRKFYRNMYHLEIPPSSIATDLDPDGDYFTDSGFNTARLRFKMPDFPMHLYLEARNQQKHGTIQQRFMRAFTVGYRFSDGRKIDFETEEAKLTLNSHVKFFEIELSQAVKEFSNKQDKVMTDTFDVSGSAFSYDHNQVSDTEATTSTVKIHTSHTGRIAAAATYSSGERENLDSAVKADFANAGVDFTWIPDKDVTVSLKYRHHEVSQDGPDTVASVSVAGPTVYDVRKPMDYTRDVLSGYMRYRATDKVTMRAEVLQDQLARDFVDAPDPALQWKLDKEISRLTMRLGATYYVLRRMTLRGDVTHQTASVPEDSVENGYADTTDSARGSLFWSPASWFNVMLSGGTILEKREKQALPFAGARTVLRNRGQASMTFLIGRNTAITPSYAYFQNRTKTPLVYTDSMTGTIVEYGVPYADTSHLASLAVTHSLTDRAMIGADVSRSWNRGSWQNAGTLDGTSGINDFSRLHVIDTEVGGELDITYTKNVGTEFQYRFRNIDDRLDDAEDGTFQVLLAMLKVLW